MTVRNRFNSVALSHRLGGLIPWFLQPRQKGTPINHKCSLGISSGIKAKPTKFISEGKVFIHGLERTGTGYCAKLLEQNLYHTTVIQSQKHKFFDPTLGVGKPPYQKHSNLVSYVICTKHPYSWFVSYKKYHELNCHNGGIPGVDALTHYCESGSYGKYITTYNNLYNNWLEECSNSNLFYVVRYEDLLENPEETLKLLCSHLNIYKKKDFVNPTEYVNNYSGNETDNGKFSRKDYYLKKEYMHDLSPENRGTINSTIDKRLMNIFGYQLEFL